LRKDVSGRPNENFTMGTRDVVTGAPNYDESDVKEIARAFTGWKFKGGEGPSTGEAQEGQVLI
jgi:uncharacterized protein (DUF1800 family)